MNLAIRISRSFDEIKQWCEELKAEKIILYQHDADDEISRTHVHMLVIGITIKQDTLKYRYKKLYGDIDKTDWSFITSYKEDGKLIPITLESSYKFITYMSKGHLTPLICDGFDRFLILELTQKWVVPDTTHVKVSNGKFVRVPKEQVAEKKKKTRRDLLEIMLCRGKDNDVDSEDVRSICSIIRDVLVENNEIMGMYKVMDYYYSYVMYGSKNTFLDLIVNKIHSQVPKNNF